MLRNEVSAVKAGKMCRTLRQRCPEFFFGPEKSRIYPNPEFGISGSGSGEFFSFRVRAEFGTFSRIPKLNDEFTFDGLVQKMQNQNKISKGDETTATVQ